MFVRGIFTGILIAIVLAVVVAAVVIGIGAYDFAADAPHTRVVAKLIGIARDRSVDVRAENIKLPPLNDPKLIRAGAAHYAEMCVGCHLAPGVPENEMRPGLNPKPPVLARLRDAEPGEWFWIVKHGLKMTAMPAWGKTHSDAEIWAIVAFLQKLPGMSPEQYRALTQGAASQHRMPG
jgi:mono/diheme cytochrome c family protein